MRILEILNIIVIPLALALLPLIWGFTGWMIQRSQLLELIFRELEEIGPHPATKEEGPKERWSEHHNSKRLLHREIILEKPSENRELILSLPADVVYHVAQLWRFHDNSKQWLHMLAKLETRIPPWRSKRRVEMAKIISAWYVLMKEYGEPVDQEVEEKYRLEPSQLSPEQRERLKRVTAK